MEARRSGRECEQHTLCGDIPFGTGANLLNMLLDWNQTYLWHIQFGRNNTWSGFSATDKFTMSNPRAPSASFRRMGPPPGFLGASSEFPSLSTPPFLLLNY